MELNKPIGVKSNIKGGVDIYIAKSIGKELIYQSTLTKEETINLIDLLKNKVV